MGFKTLLFFPYFVFLKLYSSAPPDPNAMDTNTKEFYSDKLILAPMVRMNTLPFRLLALDYGADLVYSEEIVDHKLLRSKRKWNEILNTVDYIDCTDGSLIFRTCPRERNKIVFQIGSSDPERAAKAATLVAKDVAGIDINMGCPKHFSLSGGMGAALLCNPSNARKIIERVRETVDLPVSCKIRVHENVEDTISFCKLMVESGVTAIAVHGRTPKERPRHPNRVTVIKNVSSSLSVPVIANGESGNFNTYDDILMFKKKSGCTSVMIARAAQYNPSIFRKEGKLPLDDVIKAYLKYAVHYDNFFPNTKYCIQSMLRDLQDTPRGKAFLETQNLEQICKIWNMDEHYRQKIKEYRAEGLQVQCDVLLENEKKKRKTDLSDCQSLRYEFVRANFANDADLPKSVLQRYSQKCPTAPPKYDTWNVDKLFRSVVTFNGRKYTSTYWEKNKKSAEQGAAAVCLSYLKLFREDELRMKGILT